MGSSRQTEKISVSCNPLSTLTFQDLRRLQAHSTIQPAFLEFSYDWWEKKCIASSNYALLIEPFIYIIFECFKNRQVFLQRMDGYKFLPSCSKKRSAQGWPGWRQLHPIHFPILSISHYNQCCQLWRGLKQQMQSIEDLLLPSPSYKICCFVSHSMVCFVAISDTHYLVKPTQSIQKVKLLKGLWLLPSWFQYLECQYSHWHWGMNWYRRMKLDLEKKCFQWW